MNAFDLAFSYINHATLFDCRTSSKLGALMLSCSISIAIVWRMGFAPDPDWGAHVDVDSRPEAFALRADIALRHAGAEGNGEREERKWPHFQALSVL